MTFAPLHVPTFSDILGELRRGKSLWRSLFNTHLKAYPLKGKVIDLGAKSTQASYYRFFDFTQAEMSFADLTPAPGVHVVDLEKPLPFADGAYDGAILANTVAYIYNLRELCRELRRVCRGEVIIISPFTQPCVPEPADYFRCTEQGFERLLREAGFTEIDITLVGKSPILAAVDAIEVVLRINNTLRLLSIAIAWGIDKGLRRFSRRYRELPVCLGHIVRAR